MAADFNVQNQNFNTQSTLLNSSVGSSQESGSLMGYSVTMSDDPMSLLADCAEELTFCIDTTDEFELKERKEKESIELKNSNLVKRYQEILKNGERADTKLVDMKNAILSLKTMRNTQILLQLAKDMSENSGEAYILLQEAYKELKNEHASLGLLKDLEETIEKLELHEKGKIITAMQVEITKAEDARFSAFEDGAELYTTAVNEFTNLQEVYTYIHEQHKDNLSIALDFLYKLLGNDLTSDISSIEKVKLESISTSLGELRSFQSAHALCDKFVIRLADVHSINSCPFDGFTLLGKLLDIKSESYISSSNIDSLMNSLNLKNPEEEVMFFQELINTVRQFSMTLFSNEQERVKFTDAVQSSLDEAIEREDEWLLTLENALE